MLKNYLKIAFRNLTNHKIYSFINITGLAVGMAVAILIGLWIYDELSYNQYHEHYADLAQVMQNQTFNGEVNSQDAIPRPLEKVLRNTYGEDFKYLSMATWPMDHILAYQDKKLSKTGNFTQVDFPEMLSLKMIHGTRYGLKNPNSILLSASTAQALFGNENPLNQTLKLDNKSTVKVTGVYEDLPYNTYFKYLAFIAPWDLYVNTQAWVRNSADSWDGNSFQMYAQIAPETDMKTVSEKIKRAKLDNASDLKKFNPEIFLQPMSNWHLYSKFEQGVVVGGRIQYVWMFGVIGVFVLLLACINFMNLSTARSERRAKEVGVRKVSGSVKGQLIRQFLSESLLTAFLAFLLSLLLVELALLFFNDLADKKMSLPWANPLFWGISLGFTFLTGLISGSYPAFYLSSFHPVRVLKGTFRAGRYAALPRKVLVVVQFSVSITLIIGTMIVYRQIQFTKDRPIGYNQEGVISILIQSEDYLGKINVLEKELKDRGAITAISQSSGPITGIWSNNGGFEWPGKDPNLDGGFATVWVTHDFGKTIDWQIKEGRDFSKDFATDSTAIIVNEAAVEFMNLENPVGTPVKRDNGEGIDNYRIIGVVKNMIMESPYEPIRQMVYFLSYDRASWINLRLHPEQSARKSLASIEEVFTKIIPSAPFEYEFVDENFADKFESEERIGKLAGFFAGLAILISCLGLFGLTSFMAEKRSKEIGIRKVLGATVYSLWRLLSKDFVQLILVSCLVAIPLAYYLLNGWLENYTYRTEISWWIFGIAILGALLITLITVSYQAIKAATLNPVKVLKEE